MYFYLIIASLIIIAWLIRRYFNGPMFTKKCDLSWKNIIVTGSSAGIGKETAFNLLENGANVIFACRDEKKTRGVISTIKNPEWRARATFMKLDLCNVDSIINFTKEFKKNFHDDLDILINNAGVVQDYWRMSEGIESSMMSNHIGHKILTLLLLDKFAKDEARIINLSSVAHNFSNYSVEELQRLENNLGFVGEEVGFTYKKAFIQYGNTKLANIYFTHYLAEKLAKNYPNIKVAAVHPGAVNSEFNRYIDNFPKILYPVWILLYPLYWLFTKSSFVGAQTTFVYCYEDFEKLENGVYLHDCKKGKLSDTAKDEKVKEEFMKYSWMLFDKVTEGKIKLQRL